MRNQKYIFLLAIVIMASGCASLKEASEKREVARAIQQQEVQEIIASKNYVIKVNKLFTKRRARMDLKPSHNYIVVNNDRARINLAYIGKSFSTRAISGINVTGLVEEMDVTNKKKGASLITLRVRDGGELFNVYIHMSSSGDCNIDINNARLDNISYRGRLAARL